MSPISSPNIRAGTTRVVVASLCLIALAVGAYLLRPVTAAEEGTAKRIVTQESSSSSVGKVRAPISSMSRAQGEAATVKAVAPSALKNRENLSEIKKRKESISVRASG